MCLLEPCYVFVDADAGRDCKRTDMVAHAGFGRRDEVGKAELRLAVRLGTLLAQVA